MNSRDARNTRYRLGKTQEEMAKKIGVSIRTIIKYENGEPIPEPIQNLYRLINKYEAQ